VYRESQITKTGKHCIICGDWLPMDDFILDGQTRGHICKPCSASNLLDCQTRGHICKPCSASNVLSSSSDKRDLIAEARAMAGRFSPTELDRCRATFVTPKSEWSHEDDAYVFVLLADRLRELMRADGGGS